MERRRTCFLFWGGRRGTPTHKGLFCCSFSVYQVVTEGDVDASGAEPGVAVLPLLEVLGVAIPFVVIQLLVVVGVNGA